MKRGIRKQAVITEIEGEIVNIKKGDKREITVKGEMETKSYSIPYGSRLKVDMGDVVEAGESLTEARSIRKSY